MLQVILFVVLILTTISAAAEEPPAPSPGEYFRQNDSGTLTIKRDQDNQLVFEIESIGGNCSSCSISAPLNGTTAIAVGDVEDADSKCTVSLRPDGTGVDVDPLTEEACRYFCGASAGFSGTYRIQPAACAAETRRASRNEALGLYRSQQYAEAASSVEALISRCADYMSWNELDQLRNDLALSQHGNGESAQCLETLQTTRAGEVKDEEELEAGDIVFLPPCDFDNYIQIARSIWATRDVCKNAAQPAR